MYVKMALKRAYTLFKPKKARCGLSQRAFLCEVGRGLHRLWIRKFLYPSGIKESSNSKLSFAEMMKFFHGSGPQLLLPA
ncbi:MAG: hypothetical protein ACLU4W_06860, partial [Acutalibacteraceae bacterium]